MAPDWCAWFRKGAIGAEEAASYAKLFTRENIQVVHLDQMDTGTLHEIGVRKVGDKLGIMKLIKSGESPLDSITGDEAAVTSTSESRDRRRSRERGPLKTMRADRITTDGNAITRKTLAKTKSKRPTQVTTKNLKNVATADLQETNRFRSEKIVQSSKAVAVVGGMRSDSARVRPTASRLKNAAPSRMKQAQAFRGDRQVSVLERLKTAPKGGGVASPGTRRLSQDKGGSEKSILNRLNAKK